MADPYLNTACLLFHSKVLPGNNLINILNINLLPNTMMRLMTYNCTVIISYAYSKLYIVGKEAI